MGLTKLQLKVRHLIASEVAYGDPGGEDLADAGRVLAGLARAGFVFAEPTPGARARNQREIAALRGQMQRAYHQGCIRGDHSVAMCVDWDDFFEVILPYIARSPATAA